MLTPSELVVATIGCDTLTAEKIAARMGERAVRDAAAFNRLGIMAGQTLADLKGEPAAPLALSMDERAAQWWAARGRDLSACVGQHKLTLLNRALVEIDKAGNTSTHEERALAEIAVKASGTVSALDALTVANARIHDGKAQTADGPPMPPIDLPATDPSKPLNPDTKLRAANRLSGASLSSWREWNRVNARASALPPGIDRMHAQEHATNLARALRSIHGVSVPE